jgi:hypothetical protein
MQRSGTTLVHLCLRGHPNVSALNDELTLRPFFDKGLASFTHGAETAIEKDRGHRALFEAVATIEAGEDTVACGVKTTLSTVQDADLFVTCLQERLPQVRVILTIRSDWPAQFGSLLCAQKTGIWHSWSQGERHVPRSLHVDENAFADYAHECVHLLERLQALKRTHRVLEFSYEDDILAGAPESYPKLFEFVGVRTLPVTWLDSTKVAPPPEQFVTNLTRLRALQEHIQNGTPPPTSGQGWRAAMKRLIGGPR